MDIFISLIILLIVFPILVTSVVLLFFIFDYKPFFIQKRPGKNGEVFKILKLKTMRDLRDPNGTLLPDNLRFSIVGNLIRRYSIDELPQLFNVLKGDMSLIGPRPLLIEYLPLYNKRQALRHNVRPGLTGWAQVNGRNAISWEEKFEYDVWYVENLSFKLDILILFKTIQKVLMREGINSSRTVTMEKFKGTS